MKKLMLFIAFSIALFSSTIQAQEHPKHQLAEKLLVVMELQKTIEQSFSSVTKMMPGGGQSEAGKQVLEVIKKELSWDNIKGDYIQLYSEVFSEEELKGLIEFYESPIGQAYVKKQPELTQKSMGISQKLMMKIMPKLPGMGY